MMNAKAAAHVAARQMVAAVNQNNEKVRLLGHRFVPQRTWPKADDTLTLTLAAAVGSDLLALAFSMQRLVVRAWEVDFPGRRLKVNIKFEAIFDASKNAEADFGR